MGMRSHHAATCGCQIARIKFGQADEFVAVRVAGIAREKKCDVRILLAADRDFSEATAKLLRMREANHAGVRIELGTETFARELVEEFGEIRRSRGVKARKKFPP